MLRKLTDVIVVGVLLTFVAGVSQMLVWTDTVKPAHAQPTILGPNVYAYTSVTTAQQLVGANPTRHALQICNPGGTNILWIAPQGNTVNTGVAVVPAANGAGTVAVPIVATGVVSCFAPPVNAPSIGQGWNGFSAGTPTTVYEWP